MIEKFVILTKGGVVLFEWVANGCILTGSTVNKLVKEILIEEKIGVSKFTDSNFECYWKLDNTNDLIYIVIKQKLWKVNYLESLLDSVSEDFGTVYSENEQSLIFDYQGTFSERFSSILKQKESQKQKKVVMRTFEESEKSKKDSELLRDKNFNKKLTKKQRKKLKKKQEAEKRAQQNKKKTSKSTWKKKRTWKDKPVSNEEAEELERNKEEFDPSSQKVDASELKFDMRLATDDDEEEEEEEGKEEEEEKNKNQKSSKKKKSSFFSSLFTPLTGKKLDVNDLEPVLKQLKEHMIEKNVASNIAAQLCKSVQDSLINKQLGSFTRVSSTVKQALREALTKILTPKKKINILRDINQCRDKDIPYSIVFCGINGVGKSTTLSKVCAWLKKQKYRVMISACDTFRSGAVEQLRTHAERLGVPLFHQGYGTNPSMIAKQAILTASTKSSRSDVVLIDTAGRMQGNSEQMAALAKLIRENNPNLVVFVGSALAGNDSVDQLEKFNQALIDHSNSDTPRTIDGIILTKFDTIDDKVGTTISLVYNSNLQILFLGTGQHYTDLKQLNTDAVVSALIK